MRITRKRVALFSCVLGLGIGVLVVAGEGPVVGEDNEVATLKAICTGRHTDATKRTALADLGALDTSDAHAALESLAASKDQQIAVLAALQIGRAGYSGADQKLKDIFENTEKSEAVRASALQAYARLAKSKGTSWASIESYGKAHCPANSRMEAVLMATKNAVAKGE